MTMKISKGAKRISISRGFTAGGSADIWLIRYARRYARVKVKNGESRGKTITETNVVRQLVRLGSWNGGQELRHADQCGYSCSIPCRRRFAGSIDQLCDDEPVRTFESRHNRLVRSRRRSIGGHACLALGVYLIAQFRQG